MIEGGQGGALDQSTRRLPVVVVVVVVVDVVVSFIADSGPSLSDWLGGPGLPANPRPPNGSVSVCVCVCPWHMISRAFT